jgi:Ca2+-binding EF-hand superfamily protein
VLQQIYTKLEDNENISKRRLKASEFFSRFDKDGNKVLSLNEFKAWMEEEYPHERVNVKEVFQKFDSDHNNQISETEFVDAMSELEFLKMIADSGGDMLARSRRDSRGNEEEEFYCNDCWVLHSQCWACEGKGCTYCEGKCWKCQGEGCVLCRHNSLSDFTETVQINKTVMAETQRIKTAQTVHKLYRRQLQQIFDLTFDGFDRSHKGRITKTEFHRTLSKLKKAWLSYADIEKTFELLDANGNGAITRKEFEGYFRDIDADLRKGVQR